MFQQSPRYSRKGTRV